MNETQKTIMNANLFSRLFDTLDDPSRLAIETTDGQHIDYGELISRAGQMANVLVSRGVKPGDRVAAQTEKSVPGLVLYLAAVRAGAVYLPLNTAYTLNELEYFITDAEPSLVVCDPAKADGIGAIAAKVGAKVETLGADGKGSLTDAAAKAPAPFETVARADDDLAAILYTSGTTGRSKGAMLTHDNLASNSLTLVDYWRFTNKDVLIHALPIYHTHGLFVASNVTLFARASMIFLPKFDPELIIKLMARATVLMGVPTFYTRLLQSPALSRECPCAPPRFASGWPRSAETAPARPGAPPAARSGGTERPARGRAPSAPPCEPTRSGIARTAEAVSRSRRHGCSAGATTIPVACQLVQRPGRSRPETSVRNGVENSIRATTSSSRVFARSGSSGQSRSASATRMIFGGPLTGSGAACSGADDDEQPAAARASTASAAARRPRTYLSRWKSRIVFAANRIATKIVRRVRFRSTMCVPPCEAGVKPIPPRPASRPECIRIRPTRAAAMRTWMTAKS